MFPLSTPGRPAMRTTHPALRSVLVAPRSGRRQAPGHAHPFTSIPFYLRLYPSLSKLSETQISIAPNCNVSNGSCCGLILCLFRHLFGVCQESNEYLDQDSQRPGQDTNRACPCTSRKRCSFVAKETEF
jgi:hypothetical protein